MALFRRFFFFFIVNILIVVTISFVLSLLGIGHYITAAGIDYNALIAFCLVWGMGGAFMSLALSRVMAKWMLGVRVVNPNTHDQTEREIYSIVEQLAKAASLPKTP